MKITSLQHAEEILRSYVPKVSRTGDGQSLHRMWPLLEKAGNPQEKLKTIHVAGTSGKTSTCYFISSLLTVSGKKVGLTVSPHIDSITERVQINGTPISDEEFCNDLGEFMELVAGSDVSYFELLIVFILWEFVRYGVDYAVLETGLGGLLDGTNVVTRSDKICVITDIGYDHMNVLGHTLHDIAGQKAGIIHEQNTVLMYAQSDEIMKPIQERVAEKHTKITLVDSEDETGSIQLIAKNLQLAEYQQRNFGLAYAVVTNLSKRDGFDVLAAQLHSREITVPGRMEILSIKDATVVLDGAHNEQKMNAFVTSFQQRYSGKQAVVLVAFKQGKEYEKVLHSLMPITKKILVTKFTSYQDLRFHAEDPEAVVDYALSIGLEAASISDYTTALQILMEEKSSIKVITGSFYLIGQLRSLLKNKTALQ